MNIAVIGAGGTGSYLIPLLLRTFPACELTVYDKDQLEERNLDRQLFRAQHVGLKKVDALGYMYGSRITPVGEYVDENTELQEDCDLIICCPDNHKARLAGLYLSDEKCIPCVVCGNEYSSGEALYYHPRYRGTKIDPRERYQELAGSSEDSGHDPANACTGEMQEGDPQLALANFMSAGFAVALVYKWHCENDGTFPEHFFPAEMRWNHWKCESATCENILLSGD
jgi:hypothetical protein